MCPGSIPEASIHTTFLGGLSKVRLGLMSPQCTGRNHGRVPNQCRASCERAPLDWIAGRRKSLSTCWVLRFNGRRWSAACHDGPHLLYGVLTCVDDIWPWGVGDFGGCVTSLATVTCGNCVGEIAERWSLSSRDAVRPTPRLGKLGD